jgi:hypothetical protein
MSKLHLRGTCILLVLAGCSDELVGPGVGEFEQLCGRDGPIKLLDLDPARIPRFVVTREVGDRYVFGIASETDADAYDHDVWSVGPCGEDPILLAEHIDFFPLYFDAWPELAFVCDEASGVTSAVDPTGMAPSNPVFDSGDCVMLPTPDGVLTMLGEGDTGKLVLNIWPGDPLTEPSTPIVLLDEARRTASPSNESRTRYEVLSVTEEEVFAITANDELVALRLDDQSSTVLAEGVRKFRISRDGRWIMWQGLEVTYDDPDFPEGPLFALERETGVSSPIGAGVLSLQNVTAATLGLLHYESRASGSLEPHWVRLDTMESYELSHNVAPIRVIDETKLLVGTPWPSHMWMLDVSTGELTPFFEGSGISYEFPDEGATILRGSGGQLVRIGYDGQSRVLASGAEQGYELTPDDYVITTYGLDANDLGALIIGEPETLAQRYIDTDVTGYSIAVLEELDDSVRVSYAVVDADPNRHGMWLAQPSK